MLGVLFLAWSGLAEETGRYETGADASLRVKSRKTTF